MNPVSHQISNGGPSEILVGEAFVAKVVLFTLDLDFTAQPKRRASRHPVLPQIRCVEHTPDLRLDLNQVHVEERRYWEQREARRLRFGESDETRIEMYLKQRKVGEGLARLDGGAERVEVTLEAQLDVQSPEISDHRECDRIVGKP